MYKRQGLDIAKEIRKKDPNATIVFVTTHSEFMPVTFKYRVAALDFIDKALDDEDFYERVHLAIEYTMDKMGATICLLYTSNYSQRCLQVMRHR